MTPTLIGPVGFELLGEELTHAATVKTPTKHAASVESRLVSILSLRAGPRSLMVSISLMLPPHNSWPR
jgi:hypothetical protein